MNLAPIIAGIVFGALSAGPAPAGGVLLCDPWGCRSSPYFPPPIIAVQPPVVFLPPGPGPLPPGVDPSRLRRDLPPPPLRPGALYPSPVPQAAPPPQLSHRLPAPPPALSKQEVQDQHEIEDGIMEFCDHSPDTPFCGRLGSWLRTHPRR
jgi:hypothetical protein